MKANASPRMLIITMIGFDISTHIFQSLDLAVDASGQRQQTNISNNRTCNLDTKMDAHFLKGYSE